MNLNKTQKADLGWSDTGVPYAQEFGDAYFSDGDGLAETQHVFLDGNGLPGRFCDGFHIAELGFGTGLNLLAAWKACEESGAGTRLHYTSFEAYPMTSDDMARALQAWPELAPYASRLLTVWRAGATLETDTLHLEVILGDARETLPMWQGQADAWFLDGFAPTKNPELWSPEILRAVARHTAPNGTFATYTAAGHVRRALQDAGFVVTRRPGFGAKRHMSTGILA
ncbi:MAG: tRNA (5-methylaminomethyl-2-thiouridine)(34)-methyltransferase MnmD [Paracoccaceae bacterium]